MFSGGARQHCSRPKKAVMPPLLDSSTSMSNNRNSFVPNTTDMLIYQQNFNGFSQEGVILEILA